MRNVTVKGLKTNSNSYLIRANTIRQTSVTGRGASSNNILSCCGTRCFVAVEFTAFVVLRFIMRLYPGRLCDSFTLYLGCRYFREYRGNITRTCLCVWFFTSYDFFTAHFVVGFCLPWQFTNIKTIINVYPVKCRANKIYFINIVIKAYIQYHLLFTPAIFI